MKLSPPYGIPQHSQLVWSLLIHRLRGTRNYWPSRVHWTVQYFGGWRFKKKKELFFTWASIQQWRSWRKPCLDRRRWLCISPRMEWIRCSWPGVVRRRRRAWPCPGYRAPFRRRWPWRWRRWRNRWRSRRRGPPWTCAGSRRPATSSAACRAGRPPPASFARCSRSACRPGSARRSPASGRGSPRNNSRRWRPARCRRRPALRRSWSGIRASGSATCPSGSSWGCGGKCPDRGRRNILSSLRRRRIPARWSPAACPGISPACSSTSRTAVLLRNNKDRQLIEESAVQKGKKRQLNADQRHLYLTTSNVRKKIGSFLWRKKKKCLPSFLSYLFSKAACSCSRRYTDWALATRIVVAGGILLFGIINQDRKTKGRPLL